MKKERVETLVDFFIDENGDKRYFVVAAISEVLPNEEAILVEDFCYEPIVKGLKLGFAICNPIDEFNEELGKRIAIGRARKNEKYALYATELGYINYKLVKAFLEQEAEYFKANPATRIAGYKRKA